jgi:N-methylhydantoinase A
MQIDRAAAERGINEKIAKPLGLDLYEAAAGIINVMNNNMLAAIRLVSIERGLDPRDFVLLPFGGAGPLHGGELAQLLGIPTILVPPSPGVLSAQGLTVSSLREEFSRTCLQDLAAFDPGLVASRFDDMQSEAECWLDSEQVLAADRQIEWQASLRYRHQGFELHVPWPERAVSSLAVARLSAAFHALHKQLYTFALEDTPIELVGLRVTAVGRLPPPRRLPLAPDATRGCTLIGRQSIYFSGRFLDAPIYARSALSPDQVIRGPAIVQQLDATILLGPDEVATVHPYGALLITVTT